jgi:3-hexulose-6-phosphate synthase/6-phospho-3-hexuloisomerase
MIDLDHLQFPVVQVSLDLTSTKEALDTAAVAVEAGVDWLEAGTPLLLAEGTHAVRALRERFPRRPIVADLKTMDGGYLEDVVKAVSIPVQAVGGLSIKEAISCPAHGAPLVVLGAPLVIDAHAFKTSGNDLLTVLREIATEIRKTPYIRPQ